MCVERDCRGIPNPGVANGPEIVGGIGSRGVLPVFSENFRDWDLAEKESGEDVHSAIVFYLQEDYSTRSPSCRQR